MYRCTTTLITLKIYNLDKKYQCSSQQLARTGKSINQGKFDQQSSQFQLSSHAIGGGAVV
jgi:hypothetical protein